MLYAAVTSESPASTQPAPAMSSSAVDLPTSPFGAAWGFLYGYSGVPAISYWPQLQELGAAFTKVYLFWQQIEPEKGHFNWSAVEEYVRQLPSPAAGLIALFSSSLWATQKPSAMLPPSPAKNVDDYYQFVFELVKRCRGRVRFWQNDCEPNNPVFWSGTQEEFVAQSIVFYRAVKDADPDAVVVIGGYDGFFIPPGVTSIDGSPYKPFAHQSAGLQFFDYVLREAKDAFDLFDLRLYGDPYTIPARVDYIRRRMQGFGYEKPVICTEYGGPHLFEFAENRKYIDLLSTWSQAVTTADQAGLPSRDPHSVNQIEKLYSDMSSLAPQTQMFMQGCAPDLEAKYARIQSRSVVMRNLLGLANDVKAMIYWNLVNIPGPRDELMNLLYGKIGLFNTDRLRVGARTLTADVYARMTHALNGVRRVQRLNVPGQPAFYVFAVEQEGDRRGFVAWERRDAFCGSDQPANPHHWPCRASDAEAVDLFGNHIPLTLSDGQLQLSVSLDPVFITLRN